MTEGEIVHYSHGLGYHAFFGPHLIAWGQSKCTLMLTGMQFKLKDVSSYIHVGKNVTTQTLVLGYLVT